LIGSIVLLPYAIIGGTSSFFFGSLVAAILIMAIDIRRRLKYIQLPVYWFYLWLALLAVAVSLQLTIVFKVIPLPRWYKFWLSFGNVELNLVVS